MKREIPNPDIFDPKIAIALPPSNGFFYGRAFKCYLPLIKGRSTTRVIDGGCRPVDCNRAGQKPSKVSR